MLLQHRLLVCLLMATAAQSTSSKAWCDPLCRFCLSVAVLCRTSYYNPVYLPGDSGTAGTAAPSPSPKPGTPTPSPAPQSSVSVTLGGNTTSGVAVVNTQCAVNGSLPMLSVDGAGSWVGASGIGGLGSDAVNSTAGDSVA